MSKASIIAALLIITTAIICALNIPGLGEGFRWFLVLAGIVLGSFTAVGIQESIEAR